LTVTGIVHKWVNTGERGAAKAEKAGCQSKIDGTFRADVRRVMKAFVKGDLDGFFALGLDSLVNLLLMTGFCLGLLGFAPEFFYGHVLPASVVGLVFGNLLYARQALQLAKKEGRDDVCALPYGFNLITVIIYSLLVMFPAQQMALARGLDKAQADEVAWLAGIAACVGSGLIEVAGAFVLHHLRRITPLAALLAALAGIGIFFIAMDFLFRAWVYPVIGMTSLGLALLVYYGRVRFKWGIPGGLVIVVFGTLGSWGLHWAGLPSPAPAYPLDLGQLGFFLPIPIVGKLIESLPYLLPFISIILPMGVVNVIGSMQVLASAEAAGDRFETKPSLLINGVGTLLSAGFGSPYPTTLYIGHPGWKAIGSRAGYSTLNAIFVTVICLTGSLSLLAWSVPVEAGMAILIWIGISMGTQAFAAVPQRHIPAVIVGLFPAIAGYCALVAKNVLGGAGVGTVANPYNAQLVEDILKARNFYAEGMFALEQGYFLTCLILAAATVCIIDQRFKQAALWFLAGAVLSAIGLVHSFGYITGDVVGVLQPGWKWVVGYVAMAVTMWLVPVLMEKSDNEPV